MYWLHLLSVSSWDHKIAWYRNLVTLPSISGICFFDQNENQVKDPGETGLLNHRVDIEPEVLNYFSNANGFFRFYVQNGNYDISAQPSENWKLTTDLST